MRRLLLIVSLSIVTVLGFPSTGFCEEPAGQLPAVAQDGAGDPLAKQADDEELSGRADGEDAPDAHVAENIDQEGEAPAGTISSEGGELPDEGGDDDVLIPAADELGTAQDEEAPLIECGSVCSVAASDGSGFISASGTASSSANRLSEWWESKDLGDGTYSFRSMDGGGYLGADSASKGAAVSSCASEFIWRLMGDDLSAASFAPVLNPLLRLTLLDGNALLSEDGGEGCQTFSVGHSPALAEALMAGSRDMDGLYIISSGVGSGKVLDIKAGSKNDRANAQIYSGNGSFAQSYALESAGNGLYSIRNVGSGKFLDAKGGGTANRTNVQQYSGNSTLAQLWYLIARNDIYTIKNAASGLALDVAGASSANGANVRLYTPNGSAAQDWAMRHDYPLEQAIDTGRLIPDGIYSLRSVLPGARSVDIAGASTANRANARLYAYNASFAQKYEITYVGNGFYTIQVACSGKYLDARGGKAANGTNVHQYQRNGSRAQWWFFERVGDNIFSVMSGLVGDEIYALDVTGGKNANGANIQLYRSNGTEAQRWKASFVPLLDNGTYAFQSFLNPTNFFGVASGSKNNAGNVANSRLARGSSQHWVLSYQGNGIYSIKNADSGNEVLDVSGGKTGNGANIQQYQSNGSAAQRWRLSISDIGGIEIRNVGSGKVLDVAGGNAASGANVQQYSANNSKAQSWSPYSVSSSVVKTGKTGWQNPSGMYQVSVFNAVLPGYSSGIFAYATDSRISIDATRTQVVNAFVARAYNYLGTRYIWDYACAPGVGVDCAGLVLQCLYAVGITPNKYNPMDHYYKLGHDHYANDMWADSRMQTLGLGSRRYGDLICYDGHIGIYIGNNKIIHAQDPSTGVIISDMYSFGLTPKGVKRVFA